MRTIPSGGPSKLNIPHHTHDVLPHNTTQKCLSRRSVSASAFGLYKSRTMISIKKIRLKKEKRKKYQTCHRIFHAEKNHACINCTENISHPRINIVTITEVMDMRS